jgi:uncharacterized protein YjiS (DUF1127 family)
MFRTIIRYVRNWKRIDDDVLKLRALDDYLLADIGIDRRRIGRLVRGKLSR